MLEDEVNVILNTTHTWVKILNKLKLLCSPCFLFLLCGGDAMENVSVVVLSRTIFSTGLSCVVNWSGVGICL